MRIPNLEIKHATVEILALDIPTLSSCDTCNEEPDAVMLEIFAGAIHFHAFVGDACAEKYLRMLAE